MGTRDALPVELPALICHRRLSWRLDDENFGREFLDVAIFTHSFARFALLGGLACTLSFASGSLAAQTPPADGTAAAKPVARKPAPKKPGNAAAAKTSGPLIPTRIPPPGPAEVPLFGARNFLDQRSGVTLTVPAGWLLLEAPEAPETEISRMILDGPGQPAPACGVVVLKAKQPNGVTQAQINKVIHDERNVASIRSNVAKGSAKLVELKKVSNSGYSGISMEVLVPGNQYAPDTTTYLTFFEAIGRRYSINCNVLTNDLDTMRPDIESILRTLKMPTG